MWHELMHFLGLCGEPHPSVLTVAGITIPTGSYAIYRIKCLIKSKSNE